jgi:hypothetical protein
VWVARYGYLTTFGWVFVLAVIALAVREDPAVSLRLLDQVPNLLRHLQPQRPPAGSSHSCGVAICSTDHRSVPNGQGSSLPALYAAATSPQPDQTGQATHSMRGIACHAWTTRYLSGSNSCDDVSHYNSQGRSSVDRFLRAGWSADHQGRQGRQQIASGARGMEPGTFVARLHSSIAAPWKVR